VTKEAAVLYSIVHIGWTKKSITKAETADRKK
jgi:hypothetical protein